MYIAGSLEIFLTHTSLSHSFQFIFGLHNNFKTSCSKGSTASGKQKWVILSLEKKVLIINWAVDHGKNVKNLQRSSVWVNRQYVT